MALTNTASFLRNAEINDDIVRRVIDGCNTKEHKPRDDDTMEEAPSLAQSTVPIQGKHTQRTRQRARKVSRENI